LCREQLLHPLNPLDLLVGVFSEPFNAMNLGHGCENNQPGWHTPHVATKDFRSRIEPVLRTCMADGDRLLAAAPLIADPGTTEDVSLADEFKNLFDPTLLTGFGAHPGNLLQQATWGRGVVGGADSIGGKLFRAIADATAPTLGVTDEGLLVADVSVESQGSGLFSKLFGAVEQVATLKHRVPRGNFLGAQAAPEGVLRRGRLLVAFTDGSGCALVCATPGLMTEVVAAIGMGRT